MWFKNLQIYRLTAPWTMTSEQLEASLAPQAFAACGNLDMQTQGWVPPRPYKDGTGPLVLRAPDRPWFDAESGHVAPGS